MLKPITSIVARGADIRFVPWDFWESGSRQ